MLDAERCLVIGQFTKGMIKNIRRDVVGDVIQVYQPSTMLACDVAEKMLQRVQDKYPAVRTYHTDIVSLALASTSVDAIFMNGMYGNIADKPAACSNAARMLRSGGRLVVSHPEGRAFVDQLRATSDLFIESLPTKEEFESSSGHWAWK